MCSGMKRAQLISSLQFWRALQSPKAVILDTTMDIVGEYLAGLTKAKFILDQTHTIKQ